jgi:hypothetical protein
MTRRGCVQGVEVTDILLDTGCTQTMVRGDLVSQDQVIQGEFGVCTETMYCTRWQMSPSISRD